MDCVVYFSHGNYSRLERVLAARLDDPGIRISQVVQGDVWE